MSTGEAKASPVWLLREALSLRGSDRRSEWTEV
jgi:hypothetical protein